MWKVGQKYPFFQISTILKFDFQKKENSYVYSVPIPNPLILNKERSSKVLWYFKLMGLNKYSFGILNTDNYAKLPW